mmetsp:Transcript_85486/g.161075  ORF Transcript_85486/g.161075 Transcript_85486/m.161075 type:complete len:793 (+) Transcript_85486:148-2526(+)
MGNGVTKKKNIVATVSAFKQKVGERKDSADNGDKVVVLQKGDWVDDPELEGGPRQDAFHKPQRHDEELRNNFDAVIEDISDDVEKETPRTQRSEGITSSTSLEHSTLLERVSRLEDTCRSQASIVSQLENTCVSQASMISQMQQLVNQLQKDSLSTVSVLQYNILASYLGKNTQPWFLYGAEIDTEKRKQILRKFNQRDENGVPKYGWPEYAEDFLQPHEIRAIEKLDMHFNWELRKVRLTKEIKKYDADVVSLVELDQYEYFAHSLGENWDSVFHKRPRDASLDGCGVFWRKSKFWKETSQAWDFVDSCDTKGRERRDRSCLMVLLRWRGSRAPLVVVSTHLARNPEDRAQTAIRVRQVTQLVEWLTEFTNEHHVSDSPVILLGDLNARHFGEIRGIARTVWQIKGDPMHPFLWSASDVPTGPTSVTKARQVRIDIVQYTSSQLEVMDVVPVPKLPPGSVIPNEDHPSDHFPVCAKFVLKTSFEKHKACARDWLECVAGREKLHPLTEQELKQAYEFFDRDRSGVIHRHDLEESCLELNCNMCNDVQRLLLDCFPDNQISYYNFVKAYEVRLNHERLRCIGDLECAFHFFAEDDCGQIRVGNLEAAFREITPIGFTDEEVREMIRRMNLWDHTLEAEDLEEVFVDLHKFCEVVCQASFPHKDRRRSVSRPSCFGPPGSFSRQVSETASKSEASSTRARASTKELVQRLDRFHNAVNGAQPRLPDRIFSSSFPVATDLTLTERQPSNLVHEESNMAFLRRREVGPAYPVMPSIAPDDALSKEIRVESLRTVR